VYVSAEEQEDFQMQIGKVYVGRVTNWFDRIGVAEITVESTPLKMGDRVLIIGRTTGVEELTVDDMRVEFEPAAQAPKGVRCSLAVPHKVHRGDKVYKWEEV
ncbi:MAG: hypothetical protein IKS71_00240, partial [Bacteroidales bacterium]|nr:hypothetical protein [Bacteroidales bacterium]